MKEDAGRDAIGDKEPVCFPAVFALPSSSLVFCEKMRKKRQIPLSPSFFPHGQIPFITAVCLVQQGRKRRQESPQQLFRP